MTRINLYLVFVNNSIEKTLTEFYMNKIIILERKIQQLSEKIINQNLKDGIL